MENQKKTYQLKGTADKHIIISAAKFLSILEDDKYEVIEMEFVTIDGNFDITRSNLEKVIRHYPDKQSETIDRYIIRQELTIHNVVFSGIAGFPQAEFQQLVDFRGVKFNKGHFQNSDFKYLTYFSLSEFGVANFWGAIFREHVGFGGAVFKITAAFMESRFEKDATFGGAVFSMIANFEKAVFQDRVSFENSSCKNVMYFRNATFLGMLNFTNLISPLRADFYGVRYLPDNIKQWWKEALWNCRIPDYSKFGYRNTQVRRKALKLGKLFEPLRPYLQKVFRLLLGTLGLNEENTRSPTLFVVDPHVISEPSNPQFKRYVSDQLFLRDIRRTRPKFYLAWRCTSDCGRNIFLWGVCALLLVFVFGLVYADFQSPDWFPETLRNILEFIDPKIDIGLDNDTPTSMTYLYFSVVIFTTLGFGDITPSNTAGEVFVIIEVILGYLMLGILISIFSNKIARRS